MFPATKHLSLLGVLLPLLWSTGNGIMCENRTTCDECITVDSQCVWCADEGIRRDSRCQDSFTDCGTVIDPRSEIQSLVPDADMLVVPERYEISLRPGDTLPLPISVTTDRNIPLDVYILFDLSQSLQEEIDATRSVSDNIIASLQNISTNVQAGFGSFIDKIVRPFTRTDLNGVCEDPVCYNFRNYGPLTSDRDELNRRIQIAETGSNIDAPEAGLDAIAQISLCSEEVGWREDAVKIILYFTDDSFKFAGEGRQAGILKPFEEVCKLLPDTVDYTSYSGLENDYTSPGQLVHLLEESDIIPVFIAVTSQTQIDGNYDISATHRGLAELFNIRLNGRASSADVEGRTEILNPEEQAEVADSILNTIDEQVLAILELTRLVPEAVQGVTSTVQALCPIGATLKEEGTDSEFCTDVSVGNTTDFTLSLTLESCESFGSTPLEMIIAVLPLGEVVVRITPICECDCADTEVNSPRCSSNGNYSCGQCICEEGYCGLTCQISVDDQSTCPLGVDDEECSGDRGTCLSGCQCVCYENITGIIDDPRIERVANRSTYGLACECDFFSCLDENSTDTVLCSGRGECCNGMCICDKNENGYRYRSNLTDCDCEPAEEVCREPGTSEICGDRGVCGCEACSCPVFYTGEYCEEVSLDDCDLSTEEQAEICITAEKEIETESRPAENRDCQPCFFAEANVSCVILIPEEDEPGPDDDEEATIEAFADRILGGNYVYITMCMYTDEDGCPHIYYILYNNDDIDEFIFVAEEQSTCLVTAEPSQEDVILDNIELWQLALILLAVLLLLGLLILAIIKAIFLLLDYLEVKRLEKEVGMADFSKNQNPLYQSPDVEYKNVAYGKE